MNDQPKPAAGEWTAETVTNFSWNPVDASSRLADAHNAALNTEREQADLWKRQAAFESEHREKYLTRVTELTQQLAVERERSKELSEDCEHYSEVIEKREQQLAAEQKMKWEQAEKVQTLVRELRHCANRIAGGYRSQSTMLTDDQLVTRADAVLAKVKEGK